jgi:uncharacterized membrane protein YeiH
VGAREGYIGVGTNVGGGLVADHLASLTPVVVRAALTEADN